MSRRFQFWGAHAPRVLVSAPSPKLPDHVFAFIEEKNIVGEAPTSARGGACAPQRS